MTVPVLPYLLQRSTGMRQLLDMARVRRETENQPTSEGPAMWERIDGLAKRKGITTQQIAEATGVTWAAAKRWRQPKDEGGAEPKGAQLRGIAEALGVTVDELLRVYDGYEPRGEAWLRFKATDTFRRLTSEEVKRVAATFWSDDHEPTLSAWLAIAEGYIAARRG
jgi:transcriptional regulator with XRE-family HTH domain